MLHSPYDGLQRRVDGTKHTLDGGVHTSSRGPGVQRTITQGDHHSEVLHQVPTIDGTTGGIARVAAAGGRQLRVQLYPPLACEVEGNSRPRGAGPLQ